MKNVFHIHGIVDDGLILGLNDTSQLHNDNFKQDDDILTALIKPKRNKELKELIDQECIDIINESHIIILFGLSLGDTDKFWWETIGKK